MSEGSTGVLFSAALRSIGRTTHRVGTGGAHLRYILRSSAAVTVMARGIPLDASEAAAWMDAQELADRSNARVSDGVTLALPHQLTHQQRKDLLRDWSDEVSNGVPYIIAIHKPSREGDNRNHHAHIVFRDRDPVTGKRVMNSTNRDFAERVRLSWENHVNAAMEKAGLDERTDRRSNAERGIDRVPQLHVGPAATAEGRRAARGGVTPSGRESKAKPLHSKARTVTNSVGAHSRKRVVRYNEIDQGSTRLEENERRIAANTARDRAEAKEAVASRLAAARAGMASMGLGLGPRSEEQASSLEANSPSWATTRTKQSEGMNLAMQGAGWIEAARIAAAWVKAEEDAAKAAQQAKDATEKEAREAARAATQQAAERAAEQAAARGPTIQATREPSVAAPRPVPAAAVEVPAAAPATETRKPAPKPEATRVEPAVAAPKKDLFADVKVDWAATLKISIEAGKDGNVGFYAPSPSASNSVRDQNINTLIQSLKSHGVNPTSQGNLFERKNGAGVSEKWQFTQFKLSDLEDFIRKMGSKGRESYNLITESVKDSIENFQKVVKPYMAKIKGQGNSRSGGYER